MSNTLEDRYIEAKAAAKLYAEAEVDLVKLKIAKKATRYSAKFIALFVVLLMGAASTIILLVALGFFLSDLFEDAALGFLCSAGAGFFVTILFAFLLRKALERPIIRRILKDLYNE
jgi:hypothetical protein